MSSKGYQDFLEILSNEESRGSGGYQAKNEYGYIGKYQWGEDALIDSGFYKPRSENSDLTSKKNDWSGEWTEKAERLGITSKEEFLNNPVAQEEAMSNWTKFMWRDIKNNIPGVDDLIGKEINGVIITKAGLLAGRHLLGIGNEKNPGLKQWLEGTADPVDKNGEKLSTYVKKMEGVDDFDPAEVSPIDPYGEGAEPDPATPTEEPPPAVEPEGSSSNGNSGGDKYLHWKILNISPLVMYFFFKDKEISFMAKIQLVIIAVILIIYLTMYAFQKLF